jgi:class 3 adenylate cyclase
MINISGRPAPEKCTAAMLQLDICGFTDLSQTITPMQLAMLMHKLFTYFDDTVQANGLFKMDTVGDAYIVAALLPEGETQRRCACLGLLEVAKTMIEGMRKHHRETGQQLHCRIGAATGDVTTGVLGHLQTRFHITGPGLQAAETMEQTSPLKDSLHAAPSFLDMLRAPSGALELPGWTIIPPPEEGHAIGTSLVPVDEEECFSSAVLSPPVLVFRGSA